MRYRLLLFGILLLLAVGRGMGYERPFPTYLALGGIFPINSNEGRRTPMVVIDHEAGDRRSGLLKAAVNSYFSRSIMKMIYLLPYLQMADE